MRKLIIILLIVGCEKIPQETIVDLYECKDCTYYEMGEEKVVFVCGEQLVKMERDGYKCIKNAKQ